MPDFTSSFLDRTPSTPSPFSQIDFTGGGTGRQVNQKSGGSDSLNSIASGMNVSDPTSGVSGGFGSFYNNGGKDLIGMGVSAGIGALMSNPAKDEATGDRASLDQLAKSLSALGDKTSATGTDMLAPVIKYLNGLLSGNPADTLAATQPQRAMIMDQYDTAMKTIERNAPRGGGQVSALGDLEARKASTLSTITSTARTDAAKEAAQLGTTLTGQGVAAKAYAGNEISSALQAAQRQSEEQAQSNHDTGKAIGSAIMTGLQIWASTGFAGI